MAAALYYHPAAEKASLEAVAPSSPSLALRPSQSKVLCIGSSRWWMRRRWEGKARASGISSRARARPVARPALLAPVAMEWQEWLNRRNFPFLLSTFPVELTLLADFVSQKLNVYLMRSWTLGN